MTSQSSNRLASHPLPRRATALAMLAVSLFATRAGAAELSTKLQVALLTKIFSYDAKLAPRKKDLTILVIYGKDSSEAEPFVAYFSKTGVQARAVAAADVTGAIAGADVAYILPGVVARPVAELCRQHGVLSASSVIEHVEKGDASVGLGVTAGDKPQIVVNLNQTRAEGHDLSSRLLGLARVIR